ncbi:MAG: hypothetical protein NUV35_06285, partial [Syntrophomonadaceae bacterium]|nr:hypothetical protein [Syntrophomonadaceae bacterium]
GAALLGAGCARQEPPRDLLAEKKAAIATVQRFGARLQAVPLLAPRETLEPIMREQYGDLVSPSLLDSWLRDPSTAPGRLTSSPWPDRIDILGIRELSGSAWEVEGIIVEVTSTEAASGQAAATRPVTLTVRRSGDAWLIDRVQLGEYQPVP